MSWDDFDAPSAYREVWRRALRSHRCCECDRGIAAGAVYHYASGVWDGRGDSHKTCIRCASVRDALARAQPGRGWVFGGLQDELGDFYRDAPTRTQKVEVAQAARAFRLRPVPGREVAP